MNNNTLVLVSLTLALVAALVCGLGAYLAPHLPLIWQISGVLAVVFFAAFIFLDRKAMGSLFSRRTTRYGLNVIAMSFIALGITVFLNLIANEYNWKKDFTKNKIHSLSDQSVKVLNNLKDDVTIKAFINPQNKTEFEDVLGRYTYQSKKVKVEYLDLDKDPRLLEKLKIRQGNAIIVESAAREARVDNVMGADDPKLEEKITNAIISVAKGEKKKVYFVSGHGEYLPTGNGRESLSQLKESLENSRYSVQEIVLLSAEKIPADAEIMVLAGPRTEFTERELKMLEEYEWNGGKLLFLMQPNSPASLKTFLAGFGVNWNAKKTIFEANPLATMASGNPLVPVVSAYDPSSEITRDMRQPSLFPVATPVEKMQTLPPGLKVTSLFSTSAQSLEVDMMGDKIKVDKATNRKGPLSVALSITGPVKKPADAAANPEKKDEPKKDEPEKTPEFRMVVVGNAQFASNGFLGFGANSDLVQNMMAWLAQDEDLISIRPRPADERQFDISETQGRVIQLATVIFLPLLMLISGLGVWLTRRRK